VKNIKGEINILFIEVHWWLNSEAVSESSGFAEANTVVLGFLPDFVDLLDVHWLLGSWVLDELNTHHKALSSNVTKFWEILLNLFEATLELKSSLVGILLKAFIINDLDDFSTSCHGEMVC